MIGHVICCKLLIYGLQFSNMSLFVTSLSATVGRPRRSHYDIFIRRPPSWRQSFAHRPPDNICSLSGHPYCGDVDLFSGTTDVCCVRRPLKACLFNNRHHHPTALGHDPSRDRAKNMLRRMMGSSNHDGLATGVPCLFKNAVSHVR